MNKLRVGTVFIPVLNLESSITWYTECFGLELVDNWGAGASFKFPSGEALVALIQVSEIQPLHFSTGDNQVDNVYFHFETDDLDKIKAHLRGNNIKIMKQEDHGLMNEIYIIDPSGNQIAIFCEKETSPFYKHATNKISW
ncbi:VOC family protein [Cohnella endophytica]|uniref:VOC family protein n=1 Tax=Cohnella endophytica TaxID=2419778 RepID=A0A494YBE5_9BACL|nr:VOC family protein [Cohnella endophytica]RKP57956.1 VOC family protein [Cohnella endophytica]